MIGAEPFSGYWAHPGAYPKTSPPPPPAAFGGTALGWGRLLSSMFSSSLGEWAGLTTQRKDHGSDVKRLKSFREEQW